MRYAALIGAGVIGSAIGRIANPDVDFPLSFLIGMFYAACLVLPFLYLIEKVEQRP